MNQVENMTLEQLITLKLDLQSAGVQRLTNEQKNELEKVNRQIHKLCDHEWIHDLIDIDPDRSKSICYCAHCYMTK